MNPHPYAQLPIGIRAWLPSMNGSQLAVYVALWTRLSATGQLNPTVPTLAADTGLHEDTVSASLTWLDERGLLERQGSVFRRHYRLVPIDVAGRTAGGATPSRGNIGKTKARGDETSGRGKTPSLPEETSGHFPRNPRDKVATKKKHQEEAQAAASPLAASGGGASPTVLAEADSEPLPAAEPPAHQPLPPSAIVAALEVLSGPAGSGSTAAATLGPAASAAAPMVAPASETGARAIVATPATSGTPERPRGRKSRPTASEQPAATEQVDTKELARRDITAMAAWFGYGRPAIGAALEQWPTMKPSATNWFHHAFATVERLDDASEAIADDISPIAAAAYCWWKLNRIREEKGLPLMIPGSSDLLGKNGRGGFLGELLKTRGPAATAKLAAAMFDHFGEIEKSLAWRNAPLVPDASLFLDRHAVKAADAAVLNESRNQDVDFAAVRYG